MPKPRQPPGVIIATRGSALALAQAYQIMSLCRDAFPQTQFSLKLIKTTGDKLQSAALAHTGAVLPKGLFTKELETALLNHEADLAVHSLKDLPTDLPAGLRLGAVSRRADVRDLLVYRDARAMKADSAMAAEVWDWSPAQIRKRGFRAGLTLAALPKEATVATSSVRRQAQLLALRPDVRVVPIRGNVGTRLQKLADQEGLDATILAAAGLARLQINVLPNGHLVATPPPQPEVNSPPAATLSRLLASPLEIQEMLPCVGQAAIGLEIREQDEFMDNLCRALNHFPTWQCVLAERAFLHAMGGGCQSPVAAYAQIVDSQIVLQALSLRHHYGRRIELSAPLRDAVALGETAAHQLLASPQTSGSEPSS